MMKMACIFHVVLILFASVSIFWEGRYFRAIINWSSKINKNPCKLRLYYYAPNLGRSSNLYIERKFNIKKRKAHLREILSASGLMFVFNSNLFLTQIPAYMHEPSCFFYIQIHLVYIVLWMQKVKKGASQVSVKQFRQASSLLYV